MSHVCWTVHPAAPATPSLHLYLFAVIMQHVQVLMMRSIASQLL
jgi:hypothetical protein